MAVHRNLLISLFSYLLFHTPVCSQTISYSISTETSTFQNPANPQVVFQNNKISGKDFHLSIGFPFMIDTVVFDSIDIRSRGFLVFTNANKNTYTFSPLRLNLKSRKDSTGAYVSNITYKLTGDSGARTSTFTFNNFTVETESNEDYISFQVKLYEQGNKIELLVGPNSFSTTTERLIPCLLGIFTNNTGSSKGLVLSGNPQAPTALTIQGGSEIDYLNNVPVNGQKYLFTPNHN